MTPRYWNTWIPVSTRLPEHGQKIIICGQQSHSRWYVALPITYNEKVGLISNITLWKPSPEY